MDKLDRQATLSVVFLTKNEEDRLPLAIEAASRVANRIIVVDSGSTDNTISIARAYGADVLEINWSGYGNARNSGAELASTDWILYLDADEVLTSEAINDINEELNTDGGPPAYSIWMKTVYLGRKLEHVWQPDHHVRLIKRSIGAKWDTSGVHERLRLPHGTAIGDIKGTVLHYTYRNLSHQYSKMVEYARLGAEDMYRHGKKRPSWRELLLNPLWRLIKNMVFRSGWRDGMPGLLAVLGESVYVVMKYAFLYEKYGQNTLNSTRHTSN